MLEDHSDMYKSLYMPIKVKRWYKSLYVCLKYLPTILNTFCGGGAELHLILVNELGPVFLHPT